MLYIHYENVINQEKGILIRIKNEGTTNVINVRYNFPSNGADESVVQFGVRMRVEEAEEAEPQDLSRREVALL